MASDSCTCCNLGGEFGALMQVHIQNDGPITLQFETPNIPRSKEASWKLKSYIYEGGREIRPQMILWQNPILLRIIVEPLKCPD